MLNPSLSEICLGVTEVIGGEHTRPVLLRRLPAFSQSTTNRYGEKTMLRFAVRRSAETLLDKCVDKTVQRRELSGPIPTMIFNTRRAGHEPRLRCLIDSETRSNDTEGRRRRRALSTASTTTAPTPRKTCLYDLHVENRGERLEMEIFPPSSFPFEIDRGLIRWCVIHPGKIINFSGWLLPVQYQEAIATSHLHTRTFASLFDVGHMLQTRVCGKDATQFLESLTTGDLKNLGNGCAVLTVFTDENGGILDDLIVTKDDEDKYFLVSNAGRRKEDSRLLLQQQVDKATFNPLTERKKKSYLVQS